MKDNLKTLRDMISENRNRKKENNVKSVLEITSYTGIYSTIKKNAQ